MRFDENNSVIDTFRVIHDIHKVDRLYDGYVNRYGIFFEFREGVNAYSKRNKFGIKKIKQTYDAPKENKEYFQVFEIEADSHDMSLKQIHTTTELDEALSILKIWICD